jgi:beta-galactosidase
MTGNLGGEEYQDRVRGPLNEGGSYPERQGWHQPRPPAKEWASSNPTTAVTAPGVTFYTTDFELSIPKGWDIPIELVFDKAPRTLFRLQLFVNGWQFGKFISHIGPQTAFHIPEGILNYNGKNTVALTYWSQEDSTSVSGLKSISLRSGRPVLTGRSKVNTVVSPSWKKRQNAY